MGLKGDVKAGWGRRETLRYICSNSSPFTAEKLP